MAYTYREHLADFASSGIDVFRLSLPVGWTGPDQYDYRETDSVVTAFIEACPQARLFPLLWLDGAETKWWELAHPAERALARSRATGGIVMDHPACPRYAEASARPRDDLDNFDRHHQQSPCLHSFASPLWLEEAGRALSSLLRHLDETFPDRFVGYYLCAGLSYEWLNWGNYTDEILFDYSAPMEAYFRCWLKRRYGSPAALASAWHRPVREFAGIALPLPAERPPRDAHPLLDPRQSTPAADFSVALSDAQADAFLHLCRVARGATPEPRLVGGFYGYWWTQTDFPGPARSGHLAFQRVLASPDVDFLASPYDYTNRGVGGVNSAQTLPGSIQRHGKLYVNSTDIKLADDQYGWQSFIRVPRNPAEAVELMKRDFAASMAAGQEQSWVDLFGGAFRHPVLMETLQRLQAVARAHPECRRAPRADCLVVVDEESLRWTTPGAPVTVPLFAVQKQWNLLRSGLNWVQITLEDYLAADWPEARLVYFVNLFKLRAGIAARLHAKLCAAGGTAVWVLWPGVIDDAISTDGVELLTGMKAAWMPASQGDWTLRTRPGSAPWLPSLDYGTGIGRDEYAARMKFYPSAVSFAAMPRLGILAGEGDTVLAEWVDVQAPGLVMTRRPGFTSVFSACPLLPAAILHGLAGEAGAHAYTPPGDLVYANDRFIGVYTGNAGPRDVVFRRPVRVRDLFTQQWLCDDRVSSLTLNAAPETMHLWQLDA